MKSVCIIGAGPAGLVAAKTFLQSGQFSVTVFEKKSRIGGIWALDRTTQDGFLNPQTPTNLSRFTVGFSDLDWNSVDFDDEQNGHHNGVADHSTLPMFPKAWMANSYLKAYCKKYIPEGVIRCNCKVVRAEQKNGRWNITTTDCKNQRETSKFDYVIMASGFFAQPRDLRHSVPLLPAPSGALPIKIIHTSAFRSLRDLFPVGTPVNGKKIVMLGGGNSSGETAAAVASQLSDAQWSPDTSAAERYKDITIVHVTPRPLYPLPPFVEHEAGSRSYVPLDFKLYDFSRRPRNLPSYGGRQAMEVRNIVHGALQTMMGGDLSDVSRALVSQKGQGRGSVYVALSENYAEYVRSGAIDVVAGRVHEIRAGHNDTATVVIQMNDQEIVMDDVGAIIHATGYTPHPALEMLDDATKAAIKYDPESLRLPMILEQWQTISKEAPTISFIGFYEGPYWPVMEMQARLAAQRWSSGRGAAPKPYESQEGLLELRQRMQDRGLDVPQYWLGDHLGYMEDLAKELDLKRNDCGFSEWEGMPSPSRYLSPTSDVQEANAVMHDLQKIWHECTVNGRYVARAAFRALQGHWSITRRIDSALETFPSGKLEGTATFHPRNPTADKTGKIFDLEYLYLESGTFTLSNGASMVARRRYVYRYSEAEDVLSVWFVKPDSDLEVDYLFHDLSFVKPEDARKANALVASADHPCGRDFYETEYRLPLRGIALTEFELKHTVKGPQKDYVATTVYARRKK